MNEVHAVYNVSNASTEGVTVSQRDLEDLVRLTGSLKALCNRLRGVSPRADIDVQVPAQIDYFARCE